ncbi:hypothetical protein FPS10_16145 [Pseudoruegeria sp. M32A2M]|nr:hypothetical protein [Pseudoruegeria sp. M32A2M]
MDSVYEAPIRHGHEMQEIAVSRDEILALNPRSRSARGAILFGDLRTDGKSKPAKQHSGPRAEHSCAGYNGRQPFEESVTVWLGLGKRCPTQASFILEHRGDGFESALLTDLVAK